MDKNPYVFYLISLVIGIFLCEYSSVPFYFIASLLSIIFLILCFIVNKIQFKTIFSLLVLVCWLLIGFSLVKINTFIPENHYLHFKESKNIQLISVIIKEQSNSNKKSRKYIAEVTSISHNNKILSSTGTILLLVNKENFNSVLTLGDQYNLLVEIKDPMKPLNPHQFDYSLFLKRNYILQQAEVREIISETPHSSFIYRIKNFNQQLVEKIDHSILNRDSKEFLKAYLLGDRFEMNKDTMIAYSKSGIMHLIAISGMHIAFIFGIIFSVLYSILGRKNRKTIIIVSLVFVWIFGCLVGLSSSVFRSCLMISLFYIFELLKRIPNIYHSIALSAIIILLINPYEIYSIGFQLSYLAVFSLCWLSVLLSNLFKTKNKKINQWVMTPLAVTIAAQLRTLPFVLFYFHQFSLLSIPLNILIIPYTFVITYASIIELFVLYLPTNFQIHFSLFYDLLVKILVDSTFWVASKEQFMYKNIF